MYTEIGRSRFFPLNDPSKGNPIFNNMFNAWRGFFQVTSPRLLLTLLLLSGFLSLPCSDAVASHYLSFVLLGLATFLILSNPLLLFSNFQLHRACVRARWA